MNTGSSVVALTNRASCGRQNSTVANQSPSIVVDVVAGSLGEPTRSRNLRVPRMMTMTAFYPVRLYTFEDLVELLVASAGRCRSPTASDSTGR
jgi:hypothetical protein